MTHMYSGPSPDTRESSAKATKSYSSRDILSLSVERDPTVLPPPSRRQTSHHRGGLLVRLDRARPSSEPKWAKSGDGQEWLHPDGAERQAQDSCFTHDGSGLERARRPPASSRVPSRAYTVHPASLGRMRPSHRAATAVVRGRWLHRVRRTWHRHKGRRPFLLVHRCTLTCPRQTCAKLFTQIFTTVVCGPTPVWAVSGNLQPRSRPCIVAF
jgi:hypothetical protein